MLFTAYRTFYLDFTKIAARNQEGGDYVRGVLINDHRPYTEADDYLVDDAGRVEIARGFA